MRDRRPRQRRPAASDADPNPPRPARGIFAALQRHYLADLLPPLSTHPHGKFNSSIFRSWISGAIGVDFDPDVKVNLWLFTPFSLQKSTFGEIEKSLRSGELVRL